MWFLAVLLVVAAAVIGVEALRPRRRDPGLARMPGPVDPAPGFAGRLSGGDAIPIYCPHGYATSWCGDSRKGDTLPVIEHCPECDPDAVPLRPFDWQDDDGPGAA